MSLFGNLRRAWGWLSTKEEIEWTPDDEDLERLRAREQAAEERLQELCFRLRIGTEELIMAPRTAKLAAILEVMMDRHENLAQFVGHREFEKPKEPG